MPTLARINGMSIREQVFNTLQIAIGSHQWELQSNGQYRSYSPFSTGRFAFTNSISCGVVFTWEHLIRGNTVFDGGRIEWRYKSRPATAWSNWGPVPGTQKRGLFGDAFDRKLVYDIEFRTVSPFLSRRILAGESIPTFDPVVETGESGLHNFIGITLSSGAELVEAETVTPLRAVIYGDRSVVDCAVTIENEHRSWPMVALDNYIERSAIYTSLDTFAKVAPEFVMTDYDYVAQGVADYAALKVLRPGLSPLFPDVYNRVRTGGSIITSAEFDAEIVLMIMGEDDALGGLATSNSVSFKALLKSRWDDILANWPNADVIVMSAFKSGVAQDDVRTHTIASVTEYANARVTSIDTVAELTGAGVGASITGCPTSEQSVVLEGLLFNELALALSPITACTGLEIAGDRLVIGPDSDVLCLS